MSEREKSESSRGFQMSTYLYTWRYFWFDVNMKHLNTRHSHYLDKRLLLNREHTDYSRGEQVRSSRLGDIQLILH